MGKILVAVLDWGLGHASRTTQLIQKLNEFGHEVIIASSGSAFEFLKLEFPEHQFLELPAYRPSYSFKSYLLIPSLIFNLPKFLKVIRAENHLVSDLTERENILMIISDNRYGCYSEKTNSVFIGHQLTIPLSGWLMPFRFMVSFIHSLMIKKFNQVWVPDDPKRFFSGLMGSAPGINPIYIGPLSRFRRGNVNSEKKYWITAIVSGPEPSRKKFADQLEGILTNMNKPCCLITGQPDAGLSSFKKNNLTIKTHLLATELQQLINESEYIISRSGYSSIMDYAVTQSKVILVPTPGQPEQVYLAKRFSEMGKAVTIDQNKLTYSELNHLLKKTSPLLYNYDSQPLTNALRSINFVSA